MDDPWKVLQLNAVEALDCIWDNFAKEGKESAALAPLARYPGAASWLARSMSMSTNWKARKLGAMLAGWISDPKHIAILSEMLDRERKVFREDSMTANSVGEDIMFAATRWTGSQNPQIRDAGIDILAGMIRDALRGIPWNTVHWAVANLYRATEGKHEIFKELTAATGAQMEGQRFLQNVVRALRQNDKQTLARSFTAPNKLYSIPEDDPDYSMVSSLWKAAASAEAALQR